MRFETNEDPKLARTIFSAVVRDEEIYSKRIKSQIDNLLFMTINRLTMMIAAYYFKRHRDEIIALINSDDFKERLATELANRIEMKV